ncbi:hypothetical protein N9594_01570, partial [bacterium]|nr:hypothetical protein [bacterium]
MPFMAGIGRHFVVSHAKRKNVDVEKLLSAFESGVGEGVNLLDPRISHGETAAGDIGTVDHNKAASSVVTRIKSIWIANVEGKVKIALRIHLVRLNKIEPLGHLPITFPLFGARLPGRSGDVISLEEG